MTRIEIDARALRCPMPLLKLKQALANVTLGDQVQLGATDAGAWRDIPAFVALTQHRLIEKSQTTDEFWFVVEKGE
ncbi:MAG: sulfurtransferase TusA family protein [Reinekea forsetii]|jgi:tRNA 2-thiouridine synthesizing protein A|nr:MULTISPECIES: sulfurtransferase TusA family protein [Reinekea]MDB9894485.1 sulfurtransferase TusA family protein [Reinekea forsetii]MDO7634991.1 sulfurtransferase TusA family protein [Porticoccaceae bacterium]MDO7641561.1 sulfurtransferase TusA family protein [Reinekea forsetii]MDO7673640.1 sulfurtransferase TusA family protein [Reinekea forsetii]